MIRMVRNLLCAVTAVGVAGTAAAVLAGGPLWAVALPGACGLAGAAGLGWRAWEQWQLQRWRERVNSAPWNR